MADKPDDGSENHPREQQEVKSSDNENKSLETVDPVISNEVQSQPGNQGKATDKQAKPTIVCDDDDRDEVTFSEYDSNQSDENINALISSARTRLDITNAFNLLKHYDLEKAIEKCETLVTPRLTPEWLYGVFNTPMALESKTSIPAVNKIIRETDLRSFAPPVKLKMADQLQKVLDPRRFTSGAVAMKGYQKLNWEWIKIDCERMNYSVYQPEAERIQAGQRKPVVTIEDYAPPAQSTRSKAFQSDQPQFFAGLALPTRRRNRNKKPEQAQPQLLDEALERVVLEQAREQTHEMEPVNNEPAINDQIHQEITREVDVPASNRRSGWRIPKKELQEEESEEVKKKRAIKIKIKEEIIDKESGPPPNPIPATLIPKKEPQEEGHHMELRLTSLRIKQELALFDDLPSHNAQSSSQARLDGGESSGFVPQVMEEITRERKQAERNRMVEMESDSDSDFEYHPKPPPKKKAKKPRRQ